MLSELARSAVVHEWDVEEAPLNLYMNAIRNLILSLGGLTRIYLPDLRDGFLTTG
jgi:hypothetical protein